MVVGNTLEKCVPTVDSSFKSLLPPCQPVTSQFICTFKAIINLMNEVSRTEQVLSRSIMLPVVYYRPSPSLEVLDMSEWR